MALSIEKEYFESVVASATEASGNVFAVIGGYIEQAHEEAFEMLGEELYSHLSGVTADDEDYFLANHVKRWLCLRAYETAIPHLDLVLTPTGFGVVSNQSTAPASADRVNRLIATVKDAREDAFDELIERLRGNDKWCESNIAMVLFGSLFYRAKQLTRYGVPNAHRSQLTSARPRINAAEARLKEAISPEFYQELCDAQRKKNETSQQLAAIVHCLNVIGCELDNDRRESFHHCRLLVSFLDANIRDFTTYANSTAYEANNFQHYKNSADDSCYFFG